MIKRNVRFSDMLLSVAVMSIPFGNLVFAPSRGWATITPILFFVFYVFDLVRTQRIERSERLVFASVALLIIYSLVIYFIYPPELSLALGSMVTIILGAIFYASLVRGIKRSSYEAEVMRYGWILKYVSIGYGLSLLYGLVFIASYRFGISPLLDVFSSIEARYYGGRYSFTFTEPSFASMQIFGVYGAFLLIGKKYYPGSVKKSHLLLYAFYVILAVIFISSVRLKIDTVFVGFLFCIGWMIEKKKLGKVSILIGVAIIMFVVRSYVLQELMKFVGPRLQAIFLTALNNPQYLVYSDNSLAVRFFLSNALIKGVFNNPFISLFGHGIGNASYLFFSGYNEAFVAYGSSYLDPILRVANKPLANYYNLPLRVYAEFGVLGVGIALKFWWRQLNASLVLPAIYLSMQFDSYAFFMIWLVLFANSIIDNRKKQVKSKNINNNVKM